MRKKPNGFPKFKGKRKSKKSYSTKFTNNNIELNLEEKKIKLPKVGWMSYNSKVQPIARADRWSRVASCVSFRSAGFSQANSAVRARCVRLGRLGSRAGSGRSKGIRIRCTRVSPALRRCSSAMRLVDPLRPFARKTRPVPARGDAIGRQLGEFRADFLERQPDSLRKDDEGDRGAARTVGSGDARSPHAPRR